jgi:predicted ABC-type ATPase
VPTLTLIAGPNGSGKSTLTQSLDFAGRDRLLDPDAIARRINPANPCLAAIAAGREVLEKTAEYLSQGVTFAVETTLSGHGKPELIRKAKSLGYVIHLIFVGLDTPERCITRVRNRATRGGHFVPEADVRRRYARSIANAAEVLQSVDLSKFYDNSVDGHRIVLIAERGTVVWQSDPLPAWIKL